MEGYHPELKVILDDGNYTYWKARTRANIQCIDEAWYLTEHGWKPPTVTIEGVTTACLENAGLQPNVMITSSMLEHWHRSMIHFEGTSQVQSSRKDLLATKFENMRMEEHESIADFSSKLSSLVQESRTLGKLHELELGGVKKAKGIALISTEKQLEEEPEEDSISLLEAYDKNEGASKTESQCHECKGYGHFKTDCPTVKRRSITCYKCKGIGHTQQECEYDEKMGKSMMGVADEDSEGESEDEEEVNDESEVDIHESYKEVRNALVEVGKENIELKKENTRLTARVDELQKALQAEKDLNMDNLNIVLEKMDAVKRADDITKEYFLEKENSRNLQAELDQHRKQLKMLTGTKELDKILSIGRVGKSNLGLGYTTSSVTTGKNVKFVSGGLAQDVHQADTKTPAQKLDSILKTGNRGKSTMGLGYDSSPTRNPKGFQSPRGKHQGKECYFCGSLGHIRAFCNKYWARVDYAWKRGRYHWNRHLNQFFIRKSDLYQNPARRTSTGGSRQRVYSNMALLEEIDEADNTGPWYFDSGCSRHMTGVKENLQEVKKLKGGKVTFGCGTKGNDSRQGRTSDEQPQLMNVYLVQDSLRGVRSGNNCYMWDQSAKCLSVRDDVELWHKRLGHMNVRHLTDLVNKEIVRGVPKLKGTEKLVCGPCNQGKQIKVQHKKVADVQSKTVLD
ncbi:unnamed protein product [Microthlaspi erraticum]|uniref:CCHC-type domain-containing protein n=1 Tax=Microthlaspi erraticum TaxID=1685480 RepID=A0A6D2JW14_9BRAS|nr:unnamed protein product [Microthlaspi erraticum]